MILSKQSYIIESRNATKIWTLKTSVFASILFHLSWTHDDKRFQSSCCCVKFRHFMPSISKSHQHGAPFIFHIRCFIDFTQNSYCLNPQYRARVIAYVTHGRQHKFVFPGMSCTRQVKRNYLGTIFPTTGFLI